MEVFITNKQKALVLKRYDEFLAQWGVPYNEADIPGLWGTTHCIETGSRANSPLFLFHGVGDNSAVMWVLNIAELSKYFFCIALDTPGGPGKSTINKDYEKGFNQEVGDFNKEKRTDYFRLLDNELMSYSIIPNAGHALNMERHDLVNERIIRFLK